MSIKNIREKKGITLVALTLTITVLAIIISVSVYKGKEVIQEAKLESLKTNMLLIQAKAKEYMEQADFKMGINSSAKSEQEKQDIRDKVYGDEGAKLEKATNIPSKFGISNTSNCYWLTEEARVNWGLDQINLKEDENYLIQFDETSGKVEIYNTIGFNNSYKLSDINNIEI